jgi:hypothetical protein
LTTLRAGFDDASGFDDSSAIGSKLAGINNISLYIDPKIRSLTIAFEEGNLSKNPVVILETRIKKVFLVDGLFFLLFDSES